MAGVSPQDSEPLTHTPTHVALAGSRSSTETRNTILGLSWETASEWVKGCISEKELRRVAAAIEARLVALDAKAKAKAAKRAKAGKA